MSGSPDSADDVAPSLPLAEQTGTTSPFFSLQGSTAATSAPSVFGTTGVAYLVVATATDSLEPAAVVQIQLQVVQHLSQYSRYYSAGLNEANVALIVLARLGPVVIEVTISGEQVDGAMLAPKLESDVAAGLLKATITIGYVC